MGKGEGREESQDVRLESNSGEGKPCGALEVITKAFIYDRH
jgi:hypothetical protein